MKTKINQTENSLRQRAEELLSNTKSKSSYIAVEADNLKLIHELEVYQIELDMQHEEFLQSKAQDAEKIKLFHELELQRVELQMQNEELMQARAESEELAQKYKTLYDFAPSGYFTLNNEGEILELNLHAASMLGKERVRLINSRFAFFVSNNTKPFFQLFLDKIFISNKRETCEITLNIDENEPIYLHLTGTISHLGNQCFVTAIDITKRKLAEEELLLKNVIFDTSIAANSIANLDGIITEVNNEFYLNWGYKSKYDVIDKPLSAFFHEKSEAAFVLDNLNKFGQWEGEFTAHRADGSTFMAHAVATVVRDKYGKVIGYQSSVLDVTERNRAARDLQLSEQMLKNVLKHFPGVVFWKDKELNYQGCNKAFAEGAGLKSSEQIVGKSDFELPWEHPESMSFRNDDIQVMESGKSKLHIIEIQHQAEDKIVWFDTSKVPLYGPEGQITGVLGVSTNITEQKIAEEALKASQLLLSSSIESAKNMIILSIDKEYNYLNFNSYHKTVMKKAYDIDVCLDMNLLDCILNEEDRIKSKINYDIALSGKSHITIDEYGSLERRFFETRYNPIINDKNEVIGATAFASDVTEREQARDILKLTEESYLDIINTVSEAIYIIDENGTFIEVNKGAEIMYGYVREELIGKIPFDITDLEHNDMDVFQNVLQEVAKTGISASFELWGKRKNGEIFPKSLIVNKGKFFKKDVLIATARDITERKKVEMELQSSENRFRKLLQDIESVSVQGYAPDGTTQYWNNASEKLYGFTAEEAIGKNLLELIIPAEMLEGVRMAIKEMAETGQPIPASELLLKRKDGSLVSVYSYHTIVQVPGKPQELFCFDIDLTDRKLTEKALTESEEIYRLLFDHSPLPMWIYDLETLDFLEVNQAAIHHYGYSRDEFLSMTIKDIRPVDDIPALLENVKIARNNNDLVGQWRHVKKNGQMIFVEITAHSLNYNGKKARHILVNDISDRKQIEEKLVRTQAELKVFAAHLQNIREEERILLAREIHDELAQILIAVKIDMGIMKQKLARGIENATSEDFMTNFNHIFNMVDNTIHTSRKIMSGLRSEVLELLGINETVRLYSLEFEKRHNIKCDLALSDVELELTPQKSVTLFRIYQEVLSNVVRHAEATQVRVFFGIVGKDLIMEVIDNGKGFDPSAHAKPDSFGLIGMNERVFLLDGKIDISSKPGDGTTVKVEIPYFTV